MEVPSENLVRVPHHLTVTRTNRDNSISQSVALFPGEIKRECHMRWRGKRRRQENEKDRKKEKEKDREREEIIDREKGREIDR